MELLRAHLPFHLDFLSSCIKRTTFGMDSFLAFTGADAFYGKGKQNNSYLFYTNASLTYPMKQYTNIVGIIFITLIALIFAGE